MSRFNLAIIGGGLVGASLALALQAGAKARGWKIVLIEPFAPGDAYQPSYDARSTAYLPTLGRLAGNLPPRRADQADPRL